jgi:4-alpha-glucanotransferase
MNQPLYLSLVFHLHQPVGNFAWVFEKAYQQAYKPLLKALDRHPNLQSGLHISGSLWDWLRENHPNHIELMHILVNRGQLEMLTAGYYEPILPVLSDADKVHQIGKLSRTIEQELGAVPTGMWLTERVWEPYLPKPLVEAGVRYTLVDDAHFHASGFEEPELFGYYLTEEQGNQLALFPSLSRLRYLIPFHPVDQVMEWLWRQASRPLLPDAPPRLVCMGDDGEKFGLWPQTDVLCWEEGYVEHFFEALENAQSWLQTTTPGRYLDTFPALGLAYLPTASYPEMMDWALPAHLSRELDAYRHDKLEEDLLKFLRGGFWRHFLVKYPEANHMQKRVAQVSQRIWQLAPGKDRDRALDHVWAAQCSCGYWHGVFGGIYLNHIRAANYAHLLAAEELLLEQQSAALCETSGLACDGQPELSASCAPFCLHFDLARGGTLKEWDFLPGKANLVNVMTRREEAYHDKLRNAAAVNKVITPEMPEWRKVETIHSDTVRAKELGLEQLLFRDWYRRGAFIDHFLRDDAKLQGFQQNRYPEEGDFVNLPYQACCKNKEKSQWLTLTRDGHVWVYGEFLPVRVTKEFHLRSGETNLEVRYQIQNLASKHLVSRFGVETCSGFYGHTKLGDDWVPALDIRETLDVSHYLFASGATPPDTPSDATGAGPTGILNPYLNLSVPERLSYHVRLSQSATLWQFPLEPVVQSEAGFERAYQGIVFLHTWPIHLQPHAFWEVSFDVKILAE